MAATSHFASASLNIPVSVRVEVFDSRASASKKNGTPLAKFRMRTPASTTFGCLGQAVAGRYMKESAGTITLAPQIVCVLDKEDCTFDLDDSIDIVVPNEAIRFVLDRDSGLKQQPVSSPGVAQPQVNGHGANHVNGNGSIQSGKASLPTSRQPALLQQRLATAPVAAQVPFSASPTTRQPAKHANGVNGYHNSTPQSPGLLNKKRDPYEIDSEEDANDPPSRHSSSRGPQPYSSATSRPSATKSSHGRANGTHFANGDGSMAAAATPSARCEELAPPAAVTSRRPVNPHDRTESRERSIKQVEAGAEVVSVYGTDSKGAPSPTKQQFLPDQIPMSQSSRRSVVPPGADVVSIADSGSHDTSDSDEILSQPQTLTQRSMEKRSYHNVNKHINFEDRQRFSSSRNADPTPILLKNSRGVFPVYRKGEAPSSEFGAPLSEELGNAQPFLPRSGGPHTVPRKLSAAATANGISQGPRSDPISWENFEEEFAGFDELSDFEIAPRARAATSQPNHRTQTPSRSSLKVAREPASGRDPFSSMPPRSSPLESKQARLPHARDYGRIPAQSVPRSTKPLPLPQRGSNNRASREPSVVELPEAPTSSFPKQPRAVSVAKPAPISSQSRGVGGNEIRQWIASRRPSNPEPVKSSPVPTAAAVRPLKPSQAIRKVKSMTEMKMQPKAKAAGAEVPEVFYVEDDVRQDVYNSATSSIEIPDDDDDDDALPKRKPPTAAQRPVFSRASSCVSSQSGYAESKRGRIPSSPFYPVDAITSQDQEPPENSVRRQRFSRGYSKRVRVIFSDASESSDADANAESQQTTKPKPVAPSDAIKPVSTIRVAAAESLMESEETDDSPPTLVTESKVILRATRTSHPKWKPWWHPWGWINRYETVFLVGGAIGNGPYEGYDLMNEKAGVYIEGCEAPSEDLLAAEDVTCNKDETRLMQRRERRRTRRLAGDFQWHEDDGFDSAEELAREFGENDDICTGLSIANDIEIPNTMQTDSEEDEASSSESEEPGDDFIMNDAKAPVVLKVEAAKEDEDGSSSSEDYDVDADMENAAPISAPHARLIREESSSHSDVGDEEEERSVQKLPSTHRSPLKQAELNDKVAEKHVRMERARQYALTGEVSSQSQSQDEVSVTSHDAAEIKSLARASEATSAHSTTTSVLIARQLGVSSPPSNQELAIIMSSSPTKQAEKSRMGQEEEDESEAGDDSGSNITSIPARLSSPQVDTQSSESQVEIRETPVKTRLEAATTIDQSRSLSGIEERTEPPSRTNVSDIGKDNSPSPEVEETTKAVRSAKKGKKQKEEKEKKYKQLTSSTRKSKAEVIVELPTMSQEQRSSYSETRPTASTPPPQLRSFENLNAVGTNDVSLRKRASTPVIISDDDDDVVKYVLRESPKWLNSNLQITSPVMTFPQFAGDSDAEGGSGSTSPTVARSQRKRRVTFGDDLATVGTEDAKSGEPRSSMKSPVANDHHQPVPRSPEIYLADSTPSKRETGTPRGGSQKSPGGLRQKPLATNLEVEELLSEPSPSKSKPPRAKRLPVVSFAVSESEEDNVMLSLNGLPNVVEDFKPRKGKTPAKECKPALSQRVVTPVPPPSVPMNLSVLPGPGQYVSASQPVPIKAQLWPRPRVVTPVPLPIIPPTSDSELYKTRPQVIDIDSTEPSDSKGDSDVVMMLGPPAVSPPPPARSLQVPASGLNVKLEPQAALQNEPTPSPEPVLPVIFPCTDIDDEPSSEPEVSSPRANETKVKEEQSKKLSNRARKKAEKSKEKKDKRRRRLSSRSNTAIAAALMASPRSQAIITSIDKASGGRRSSGNFQPLAPVDTMVQIRKRQKKNKRRDLLRALPRAEAAASPVQHGFAPIAGRKRRKRRESADQEQEVDIRTDVNDDTSLKGDLLAEAVKRAKKRKLGGPTDNIIKREKKVDGGEEIGRGLVDEAGFLQSSSSHGNIPSSHPSLISPPTTSRPSSAGSRGSR